MSRHTKKHIDSQTNTQTDGHEQGRKSANGERKTEKMLMSEFVSE